MSEFWVEVYEGVGKVRRVPVVLGEPLTIGRTQSCDITVTGPGVSRLHCQVVLDGEEVRLENKSSTKTGTRVNGKRVNDALALSAGDEISIGETVLVLSCGPASAAGAKGGGARQEPETAPVTPAAADEALPNEEPETPEEEELEEEASEEAEEDPAAEASAKDVARDFVRRKQLERNFRLAVGVVAMAIVSMGLAFYGTRYLRGDGTVATNGPAKRGPTKGTPPADWDDGEVARPPVDFGEETTADDAWHRLQMMDPDAVPEGLAAFAELYEDDRRADDALFFCQQLRSARREAGSRRLEAVVEAMLAEARRLRDVEDPARAQAVFELVESLLPGSEQARAARDERGALRREAASGIEELRNEAQALSARLGPVQAIVLVLEAQNKLRGLGQDEGLDALVADLEKQAAARIQQLTAPTVELSGTAGTVQRRALDAALLFDFNEAWLHLNALLELGLTEEARLRAHWLRHQVRGLEALRDATLAAAKRKDRKKRPTLTVGGKLRASLISFDAKGIKLAPILDKGSGELKWRWGRVNPFQVQELFAAVGQGDAALTQAKAFHAFKTGLDADGTQLLIPLTFKKKERSEVFSFYSLAAGVPMPEGGFIVFEGRLTSHSEKDRILASRKEAREAARALAQEAREEKDKRKLLALLQRVLAIMDEGHYAAGREALGKLAKRHRDVPGVGDAALARYNSPMLRRRDIRVTQKLGRNGPPVNRLDIYFMGDGFLLDDRRQLQFDRYADSAARACQLQDFFKEYDRYINYWAVNLASKEEGLTIDGQTKDTALGTEINGGVYTVGSGRAVMFRLLERWFPGEHDRLAVSVGNEFATVATGGGGTVAVAKTMVQVTPHELGHAYGGLGDEYDQEPGPNPGPPQNYTGPPRVVAPNIVAGLTADTARTVVPWKGWLDTAGTGNWTGKPIDVFEGANRQPRGYWRPQRVCVMKDSGSPFCAVCMEIMVKRLYTFVKPIDQVWPEETELTAGRETITLRVLVMKPATHDLFVHWRREGLQPAAEEPEDVDEEPDDPNGTRVRPRRVSDDDPMLKIKNLSGKLQVIEGNYVHYIKVRPRDLEPGRYAFSAEVWDPTPWVRDSKTQLNQTQRWVITVPDR
jgi:hypothetical protein